MAGGLRVIQGGGFRQRRKATKIQSLKNEQAILKMANKELIDRLKFLLKTMKELEKDTNWAVTSLSKDTDEVVTWIGEGDPPTIIAAALARIRGAAKDFDEKVELVGVPDDTPKKAPNDIGGDERPPFVVYGPDSMPAGGMVQKPKD